MGYTQETGNHAEQLACQFLKKNGLKLLEKNFSCRFGEIDLVMTQDRTLVFVEVRSRQEQNPVDAATSIDNNKQRKLIRTAEYYMQKQKVNASIPARFDVVAITWADSKNKIDWIQNAIEG